MQPTLLTNRQRVESVDVLRGLVMVLMALDHVRDYFSATGFKVDPADLTQTTTGLFLTRWVTHFCAPVFVFLAGTSAHLSCARGKSKGELSRFLLTRGLFLVLLDPTVIRVSWLWDLNLRFTFGQVIWAIGWSMIVLAGLIHIPRWCVAAFAVGMIAGHNLLDGILPPKDTAWGILWRVLHVRDVIEPCAGFQFWVLYPLIPWVGVLAGGYVFGQVLAPGARNTNPPLSPLDKGGGSNPPLFPLGKGGGSRRRGVLTLGIVVCVAFVVVRRSNVYGDPRPWAPQKDALFTFFSFLNCEKYPPSLLFLLMTLGPAIVGLGLLDRPAPRWARWLTVFGRVPMFYYLLHVPLIHALAVVAAIVRYGSEARNISPDSLPPDWGYGLGVVYAVWIGVVVAIYFPCRWYAGVKQRRRDWWLSYV